MKQLLPIKLIRLQDIAPYSKDLYVITRNNIQLGNALPLDQALTITNWLDSISYYYNEETEEWILD